MPISVSLATPANQTVFRISDAPQMPSVTVEATVVPPPGPGALAQYQWAVELRFAGTETVHGRPHNPILFNRATTTPRLVINPGDWGNIRGGNLTVNVTATINGQTATARLAGRTVVGTNPTLADLRAALGTDVLRRIAHQESNFRQFGNDNWPLFSADNLGGAGVMQITPANEDQRWNWRTNVQAGSTKYDHCYDLTATYQTSVRNSTQFKDLVKALNQSRAAQKLPAVTVTVPAWSDDQRMRDAIRGYNGWAGQDPIVPTLHLHEYKLSVDAAGQLQTTVNAATNETEAVWVEVPAADRPQTVGDPDYVNHVLAQDP